MPPAPRPALLLVSMPFFSTERPSLQLGLLAAVARQHGFAADTCHLSLDFAAKVGVDLYEAICAYAWQELGEWLFAAAAFPDDAPDPGGELLSQLPAAIERFRDQGGTAERLLEIRNQDVPAFLHEVERSIDRGSYAVIGFTSTFQQNAASFALARRIKQRHPQIVILFGGANFEGAMGREWVRALPFIDYAVDGKADAALPALLQALWEGRSPAGVPGVVARAEPHAASLPIPAPQPLAPLDELPVPDYAEYFARADALGLLTPEWRDRTDLPFESSRGCWWGARHHCTFCSLNGAAMSHYQKSPARVMDELATLVRRHGVFKLRATDNIMPLEFFDSLLPALRREGRQYNLFFELKANMTRAQVKTLAEGGVHHFQTGIESLSSNVLRLMRKGVRAAQNVNLLRWSAHYGLNASWNLLWGFPGETEEDYRKQAALIPHLVHLQPPTGGGRIAVERFSPFHSEPERFGIVELEPIGSLSYIYPGSVRHTEVSYLFDHRFRDELPEAAYAGVGAALEAWRREWRNDRSPPLIYRWTPGLLRIEDGRNPADPKVYRFEAPLSEIYAAIVERPLSAGAIAERLDLPAGAADEIAEALDLLAAKGLVMRDEELFLALALPAIPNA